MLDRDSWPVWCAQNGVSPDARSVVANGDPDRKNIHMHRGPSLGSVSWRSTG